MDILPINASHGKRVDVSTEFSQQLTHAITCTKRQWQHEHEQQRECPVTSKYMSEFFRNNDDLKLNTLQKYTFFSIILVNYRDFFSYKNMIHLLMNASNHSRFLGKPMNFSYRNALYSGFFSTFAAIR